MSRIRLNQEYRNKVANRMRVQDAEIIRCNSGGLVIYNPKNLAERIKGMKNKNHSREDKIRERALYEKQQSQVVN